jgi:hypothetical protein
MSLTEIACCFHFLVTDSNSRVHRLFTVYYSLRVTIIKQILFTKHDCSLYITLRDDYANFVRLIANPTFHVVGIAASDALHLEPKFQFNLNYSKSYRKGSTSLYPFGASVRL